MGFALGKAVLVMGILAGVGAAGVALQGRPARADLEVWAFTGEEVSRWRAAAPAYERETGASVAVREVSARAIDTRLLSMMMSGQQGDAVPDVVTVEIGSVGKYFRPPAAEVGFVPLEAFLKRDGLDGVFLPQRLAAWSKGGHLFGLPLDVHPVTITYRHDLFDEAGVDLAAARTWRDFQARCEAFQAYWRRQGAPGRAAIELPEASADVLYMMLLQRGVNVVDDSNVVRIDDPKVADTIAFYACAVAGEQKIGRGVGGNVAVRVRALVEGDVCATVTPDWGIQAVRQWGPELDGKLAMMALPVFDNGDAPTSTWGGTMAGIPRGCRDVDKAWSLLKHLVINQAGAGPTLPAVMSAWNSQAFRQPDPFFAGQHVGELYTDLAGRLPRRVVTPFTTLAIGQLSRVLHRAVQQAQHGVSEPELRRLSSIWLADARADLERFIRFGEFE